MKNSNWEMSKVYDFILVNIVYLYPFFDIVGYFLLVTQKWKKQVWHHDRLNDASFVGFIRKKWKHDPNFKIFSRHQKHI